MGCHAPHPGSTKGTSCICRPYSVAGWDVMHRTQAAQKGHLVYVDPIVWRDGMSCTAPGQHKRDILSLTSCKHRCDLTSYFESDLEQQDYLPSNPLNEKRTPHP